MMCGTQPTPIFGLVLALLLVLGGFITRRKTQIKDQIFPFPHFFYSEIFFVLIQQQRLYLLLIIDSQTIKSISIYVKKTLNFNTQN